MMTCTDAARSIARRVDGQPREPGEDARLDDHLDACDACRAALAEQRSMADLLRARPAAQVSPGFAASLARRLDAADDGAAGVLDLADWRRWTFRLAPLAAALGLAAFLGSSASEESALDLWTAAGTTETALLRDTNVTSDAVLDAMLTGVQPAGGGDVR